MNTNLSALVSSYHSLKVNHQQLVLATIIETMGSTYRKAGARMLITNDAEYFGLLGGGCFEADLLAHAQEVFSKQKSKIVFYDMRAPDDEIWGLGLGCNGAVRIFLQLFSIDDPDHPLVLIEKTLTDKRSGVLLTRFQADTATKIDSDNFLLHFGDKQLIDTPADLGQEHQQLVDNCYQTGSSQFAQAEDGDAVMFCSLVKPPFHLLIIGAGPDAGPIVEIARMLGWEITLIDYREAFLQQAEFDVVDNALLSTPEELAKSIDLQRLDAVVLMTHKIEYDERYLKSLLTTSARYIGLLGPVARRERLLDQLGEDKELIVERVYGPVGLDLGGELPEEIALSLVAEIQAVLYGKNAGSLNSTTAPLHQGPDYSHDDLYAIILAAGGATRFGGLKQLIEYQGSSLLRRSIAAASEVTEDRIKVVLGARAQKIRRDIESLKAGIVHNENWEDGIASSIQAGIESLPDDCHGILLLLCDQARIEAGHLQLLLERWLEDKSRIVASEYADTIGAPVIIPREVFDDIMKLRGDKGAKSIIEKHPSKVTLVNIPEGEFDVDTQDDYMALLSEHQ